MPNDTLNSAGAFVPLTAEMMRSQTSLKKLVRVAVQSSGLRKGTMKMRLCLECRQKRGARPYAKCCLVEQKAESKRKSEKRVRKVTEEHIVVCGRQPEMLTGERA